MAASATRIQALTSDQDAGRFDAYCAAKGFKKSTLIARLIRDHLDRENFATGGQFSAVDLFSGAIRFALMLCKNRHDANGHCVGLRQVSRDQAHCSIVRYPT